jgi:hypothetical protein
MKRFACPVNSVDNGAVENGMLFLLPIIVNLNRASIQQCRYTVTLREEKKKRKERERKREEKKEKEREKREKRGRERE